MNPAISRRGALKLFGAAAVAPFLPAITSCSFPGAATVTGLANGIVTLAQVTEPANTDPLMDGSLAGYNLFFNEFDQLTSVDAAGAVQPRAAESWTSNDDFTRWSFRIRPGIVFHDGTPLTAEDARFSYQQVLETPTSANTSYMVALDSVEAQGDAVVFTLKRPFASWPRQASMISIVPKDYYLSVGSAGFANAPIGSGPYKFDSWRRGSAYIMTRNDDYWGPTAPTIRQLRFALVPNENSRLTGVEARSLDVALIPPNLVPVAKASEGIGFTTRPANELTFLGINPRGPLSDVNVRRAIDLAIDRSGILASLLGGLGSLNGRMIAPNVDGAPAEFPDPVFDVAAARSVLATSRYDGEPIPLEYATDGRIPMSAEIAQTIAGNLSAIGVNVQLIGTDQASHTLKIRGHKLRGLYLNTYAPSTVDGDVVVTDLFYPDGGNNYHEDPDCYPLVEKQQSTAGAEREAAYRELFELNRDRCHILPLFTPAYSYAISRGLEWRPRADGEFVLNTSAITA